VTSKEEWAKTVAVRYFKARYFWNEKKYINYGPRQTGEIIADSIALFIRYYYGMKRQLKQKI
jgi:hypothetical protein